MSYRLRPALGLTLTAILATTAGGCDMHRWAYVQIQSAPRGAVVHSKGLPTEYRLKARATPAGQFLPCTPIDQKADVVVKATHWSYVLKKDQYNDEQLFVERSAVAAFCADNRDDARAKPFVLKAKMVRITSEKGLKTNVKITSSPPGASIYDVGTKDLLGKTPAQITFTFFAPYKVGRLIEFRLPGYTPARRLIRARSINLHVQMLRPGEKPRPVAPPPKRKVPTTPPVKRKAPVTPPAKRALPTPVAPRSR